MGTETMLSGTTRLSEFTRTLLILFALFPASISSFAQQDSVKPGVMKVRRAPVPSSYYVQLSYSYSAPSRGFLHIFFGGKSGKSFGNRPIDGNLYPPQPVSIPAREDDTTHLLQDSTFLMQFFNKDDRPAGDYQWINWLNQTQHYFLWTDTAGIDSCVFVYRVNTHGRVEITNGALDRNDSSAAAMQMALWPYMRKLWLWYPAIQMSESGKQKKVNCTVTVKVFAVRNDQPEKMPLEIIEK